MRGTSSWFLISLQILRIHDWGSQQRAVAKDHRGRYISIPTNYPVKIQQLLKTLGENSKPFVHGREPLLSLRKCTNTIIFWEITFTDPTKKFSQHKLWYFRASWKIHANTSIYQQQHFAKDCPGWLIKLFYPQNEPLQNVFRVVPIFARRA